MRQQLSPEDIDRRSRLAAELRRYRRDHQLIQSELAALLQISLRTLQLLEGESTTSPRPSTVLRFDVLNRRECGRNAYGTKGGPLPERDTVLGVTA